MQRARSLQKTVQMPQKLSHLRGLSLISVTKCKKQDFCFLEQGEASKSSLLQCKESVKIALHTKTEKKILTKM